jgi:hypothetical protein
MLTFLGRGFLKGHGIVIIRGDAAGVDSGPADCCFSHSK